VTGTSRTDRQPSHASASVGRFAVRSSFLNCPRAHDVLPSTVEFLPTLLILAFAEKPSCILMIHDKSVMSGCVPHGERRGTTKRPRNRLVPGEYRRFGDFSYGPSGTNEETPNNLQLFQTQNSPFQRQYRRFGTRYKEEITTSVFYFPH
jgi:hypothetical protein